VAKVLSEATEDEIRDFEVQLRTLQARAGQDLQQNVYQNRTQFIKISKEAEKLKGEMRALKTLMADLKTNATALRTSSTSAQNDSGFSTGMSKRDKRSSVADRSLLWQTQMQVCVRSMLEEKRLHSKIYSPCIKTLRVPKNSYQMPLAAMSFRTLGLGWSLIMRRISPGA